MSNLIPQTVRNNYARLMEASADIINPTNIVTLLDGGSEGKEINKIKIIPLTDCDDINVIFYISTAVGASYCIIKEVNLKACKSGNVANQLPITEIKNDDNTPILKLGASDVLYATINKGDGLGNNNVIDIYIESASY